MIFNKRKTDKQRQKFLGEDLSPQQLVELVKDDSRVHYTEMEHSVPLGTTETAYLEPITKGPHNDDEAQCFALMGAVGGVGVTSLCVQLAHTLALESQNKLSGVNRLKEPLICLIDLDFEAGACAHHLDLQPGLSIEDLNQSPERIDRNYLAALTSTHHSGIDLLATPNKLGGNDHINPQSITAILDAACQIYDHVILDVPRLWRPWNKVAIMGADKFGLVTDLTIPSLHLARQRIEDIEKIMETGQNCEIILNKYERRSFRNSLQEKDAQTALNRHIATTICIDNDTVREAMNCGEPAGVIRAESRYVKDVKSLQNLWAKTARNTKIEAA